MKNRLIAFLAALLALPMFAQAEGFVAGEHYEVLSIPVQTADAERVEVAEVFSYGCIHCFTFDPLVEGWKAAAPDDVRFERVPAVFSRDWELLAQLFYTAEVLDVLDVVHTPIFNAIHAERVDLRDPNRAAALFEEAAGVSPEQFIEVSNSFSVRSRVQQASGRTRAYRVNAVPTMIVAGKYRIDGRMAGGNSRMLEVVDYLVELERQARQGDQLEEAAAAEAAQ